MKCRRDLIIQRAEFDHIITATNQYISQSRFAHSATRGDHFTAVSKGIRDGTLNDCLGQRISRR